MAKMHTLLLNHVIGGLILKKYWDKELYLYSCSMDEVTICTLRQTSYLRIFYLKKN